MKDICKLITILFLIYTINRYATTEISTRDNSDTLTYFKRIIKSRYFVDKTNLLKVFLQHERPPEANKYAWDNNTRAVAFLSPKGFGKTTNLDMVRRFFELPIDKTTGQKIDKKTTNYYKLFTNKSLNLDIAQEPNFIEEHFGEYPMIYLDFSNAQGNTTDEIITSMRKPIGRVIKSYRWLCIKTRKENNNSTDQRLKQHLANFKKTTNTSDLVYAVEGVAELLAQHFNKRLIMVLIDAYDSPITYAINNNIDAEPIFRYMDLLVEKFVNYKRVPCHVMIVGVDDLFFDGWYRFVVFGKHPPRNWIKAIQRNLFLRCSHEVGRYFGFTDIEVHLLLNTRKVNDNEKDKVKKNFNHYKFFVPSDSCANNISLYHPKGVLRYLKSEIIEDQYLGNNELGHHLMKCLRHEKFFEWVLRNLMKERNYRDSHYTSYLQDIVHIKETNCSKLPYKWTYEKVLLDNGYLSYTDDGLKIPNKIADYQLKRGMNQFFFDWYGISITNSYITTSIQSFFDSRDTTDEMLINLADSLQQMINSTRTSPLNKFQFLSIMFGTLFNNRYYDKHVITWDKYSLGVRQLFYALMLPNYNRKIVLIVGILHHRTLQKAIECAERSWYEENRYSVKYLGINLNKMNQVEIGMGKNYKLY